MSPRKARSISHEPKHAGAPEWLGDGDWEIDFEPDDGLPSIPADLRADQQLSAHHASETSFDEDDDDAPGIALALCGDALPRLSSDFVSKVPATIRRRIRVEAMSLIVPNMDDLEAEWLAIAGPAFLGRAADVGINITAVAIADDLEWVRTLISAAVSWLGPDHRRADAFDRFSELIGRPIDRSDPRHPLAEDFIPF